MRCGKRTDPIERTVMTEPVAFTFMIAPDHPALPGHFPGYPVVPGVVIIDEVLRAIERTASLCIRITGAPSIKFLAPLLPGEVATIRLHPVNGATLAFTVSRDQTLLASGQWSVQAP